MGKKKESKGIHPRSVKEGRHFVISLLVVPARDSRTVAVCQGHLFLTYCTHACAVGRANLKKQYPGCISRTPGSHVSAVRVERKLRPRAGPRSCLRHAPKLWCATDPNTASASRSLASTPQLLVGAVQGNEGVLGGGDLCSLPGFEGQREGRTCHLHVVLRVDARSEVRALAAGTEDERPWEKGREGKPGKERKGRQGKEGSEAGVEAPSSEQVAASGSRVMLCTYYKVYCTVCTKHAPCTCHHTYCTVHHTSLHTHSPHLSASSPMTVPGRPSVASFRSRSPWRHRGRSTT